MAVQYDGISLQNGRPVNMDSLLLNSRRVHQTEVTLAAVCDGVGSLSDGAFAASSAVRMLNNWFENLEDTDQLGLRLHDYIFSVNLGIVSRARSREMQTASTLSCLLLWGTHYAVANVGDSRVYTWDGDAVIQLTKDQVKGGKLTASVGHREDTEVFYLEGAAGKGQKFLVCSDGLYKKMDPKVLAAAMEALNRRNLRKTICQLADYVIGQGERDNVSAAFLINS